MEVERIYMNECMTVVLPVGIRIKVYQINKTKSIQVIIPIIKSHRSQCSIQETLIVRTINSLFNQFIICILF
jgi:hypothetical protein